MIGRSTPRRRRIRAVAFAHRRLCRGLPRADPPATVFGEPNPAHSKRASAKSVVCGSDGALVARPPASGGFGNQDVTRTRQACAVDRDVSSASSRSAADTQALLLALRSRRPCAPASAQTKKLVSPVVCSRAPVSVSDWVAEAAMGKVLERNAHSQSTARCNGPNRFARALGRAADRCLGLRRF